ncbi:hypothetical protein [uncultured Shewanella sp.]|uniref:hypothetical protein n=1 Tax=uncultured Shewanella sp. TaxID=173975 RepID=UPI0026142191|nr:hypothetical protein [uncultured Shewanella sp.]
MKFIFFSVFKYLVLTLCLVSLSGCIMVARKGIGQLRGTETEISACPIAIPFNDTQYAVQMTVLPNADKLTGEESVFIEQLQKDFTGKAIQFKLSSKVTSNVISNSSQANEISNTEKNPNLSNPSLSFQFNNIERSWLWNQFTLTGEIVIKNKAQTVTRPFTVITHKTFDVADSFLASLSEKLSQCVIDVNSQAALSNAAQP